MKVSNSGVMGPVPGPDAYEVEIPYKANRNETEVEEYYDQYTVLPSWEIWDWLELVIPDMHDQDPEGNDIGSVSWMALRRIDKFAFFFRDAKVARAFKLKWGE